MRACWRQAGRAGSVQVVEKNRAHRKLVVAILVPRQKQGLLG
jgi:hypothetical protein